jgi:hypothetical protein
VWFHCLPHVRKTGLHATPTSVSMMLFVLDGMDILWSISWSDLPVPKVPSEPDDLHEKPITPPLHLTDNTLQRLAGQVCGRSLLKSSSHLLFCTSCPVRPLIHHVPPIRRQARNRYRRLTRYIKMSSLGFSAFVRTDSIPNTQALAPPSPRISLPRDAI